MKIYKLIYDKYENDIGISYTEEQTDHTHIVIDKLGDNIITKDRPLEIYTWGIKKHMEEQCDVAFDVSLFSGRTNQNDSNYKNLTGLDEVIQQSILNHPLFDILMEKVLLEIEDNNHKKIGFFCKYGKHRSVGWAELLHKLYYEKAVVKHMGIG